MLGSSRPVPGDVVLQVVDRRDTAFIGHRNFAIERDLACLPGPLQRRHSTGQ
jgi:hypothetical protein